MHNRNDSEDKLKPWYQQFWPWFLIAIPTLTVLACIVTIIIAISTPNSMVIDDYAKIGLTIQQLQSRDKQAARLALFTEIQIDRKQQLLIAYFPKHKLEEPSLIMHLSHPTIPSKDQEILLARDDDYYFIGKAEFDLDNHWYLQLEPLDQTWRLNGKLHANSTSVRLISQHQP